jgi:hypothetical protein
VRSGSAEDSPQFLSSGMSSGLQKLAGQNRRWVLSSLLGKALGERLNVTLGKIQFHTLHTVHGEENYPGGKGLAIFDLRGEIVEARHVDSAQAEAFRGEVENRAPKLFARVGQRRDHERARTERARSLRFLIKASAGHGLIVVCGG